MGHKLKAGSTYNKAVSKKQYAAKRARGKTILNKQIKAKQRKNLPRTRHVPKVIASAKASHSRKKRQSRRY